MEWSASEAASDEQDIADLPFEIGKAGASESVAIIAIIWALVIVF